MDDSLVVLTQAAAVERRCEVFDPATGSLVHSDDIKSRAIGFRGDAAHIVRLTAAFKAVHQYNGLARCAMRLPVAEAEQLGRRLSSEEPRLGGNSGKKRSAWPTAWEHRHDVWIAKQGCQCKVSPVMRHRGVYQNGKRVKNSMAPK